MEEEWEAFIAEAKARGYRSSTDEDEPLTIIPSSHVAHPTMVKPVVPTAEDNGPVDAEEAVRSAGLGMSFLSLHGEPPLGAPFGASGKRQKTDTHQSTPTVVVPVMTPAMYKMLSPPRQELFFDELAVVGSVGLYPPKHYSATVQDTSTLVQPEAKRLPSSIFLSPTPKLSIQPTMVDDGKSRVCLSFGHLFCLLTAMPFTDNHSSQWAMHVERLIDGRLLFKEVSVAAFADRASAFLSLYLPCLQEHIPPVDGAVLLNDITVMAPIHPIALLIPASPFAEALLAVTAMMAPARSLSVGRLDAMTGSVHQVQSVTLDISRAAAVHRVAYLLERLLVLPAGDYILVHRRGADNVIVTRERGYHNEIVFNYPEDHQSLVSIDQININ